MVLLYSIFYLLVVLAFAKLYFTFPFYQKFTFVFCLVLLHYLFSFFYCHGFSLSYLFSLYGSTTEYWRAKHYFKILTSLGNLSFYFLCINVPSLWLSSPTQKLLTFLTSYYYYHLSQTNLLRAFTAAKNVLNVLCAKMSFVWFTYHMMRYSKKLCGKWSGTIVCVWIWWRSWSLQGTQQKCYCPQTVN